MIKGTRKTTLTPQAVLDKISEYDIFMRYMPDRSWRINQVTISPFTRFGKSVENHPSFLISSRSGTLNFIDFTDTNLRGDCFTFVKLLHHMLSMDDVLKKIDLDFGLGISNKVLAGDYKRIVAEYKQPAELGKRYALIQAVTRKFTKEELDYWNQYHQSLDDLRANNVYSIKELFLNRSKFMLNDADLRFGYLYDGHWKIYRPFVDKRHKWVPNNVPITALDGIEDILNCGAIFINKSKKDHMVMKKIFPCSCAVQNEGVACFSVENVEFMKANSMQQILSFDSDVTGVANSQQITKLFGFDYCNVPKEYLKEGIKDWADLAKAHGMNAIEQCLKNKGIL